MNAFLPYYRASKQQPKSGYKDDDYLEDACDNYESKENTEFKFRHVVTYLQCMPKFDASLSEKEAEELAKPSGSNTNNNVPIMGGTMERPIGSKASKDLAVRTLALGNVGIGKNELHATEDDEFDCRRSVQNGGFCVEDFTNLKSSRACQGVGKTR